MVGGCEYDRPFMCAETDGVTEPHRRAELQGPTPPRRSSGVDASRNNSSAYGDGLVGAALSHIAKRRSSRCPDQGRLGDRSLSAIQHCTSEAASPLSTQGADPEGTDGSRPVRVFARLEQLPASGHSADRASGKQAERHSRIQFLRIAVQHRVIIGSGQRLLHMRARANRVRVNRSSTLTVP
jgi:hypothetical protein